MKGKYSEIYFLESESEKKKKSINMFCEIKTALKNS